jgi:Flp pilus assembly protein TadG
MKSVVKDRFLSVLSRNEGTVSVEFVILFPLLALIVVGLMEFGYLWFVRHTLTNASREGARAAVVYYVGDDRTTWAQNTAQSIVNKYLQDINFPGTWTVTTTTTGSTPGDPVTVTITTPNGLLLLDKFIPAFNGISVLGVTTMKME